MWCSCLNLACLAYLTTSHKALNVLCHTTPEVPVQENTHSMVHIHVAYQGRLLCLCNQAMVQVGILQHHNCIPTMPMVPANQIISYHKSSIYGILSMSSQDYKPPHGCKVCGHLTCAGHWLRVLPCHLACTAYHSPTEQY